MFTNSIDPVIFTIDLKIPASILVLIGALVVAYYAFHFTKSKYSKKKGIVVSGSLVILYILIHYTFSQILSKTIPIGPLEIRYYGIIYALGFLIAYLYLRKKREDLGLTLETLDTLLVYLLIGTVVGARVFEVIFYRPSLIWTRPLEILMIWHGGLSFHGGLIGSTAAMIMFSRKRKLNTYKILDTVAPVTALALAFGRIANFTNSELVGIPSNAPWCVLFTAVDNVCRHPYQIYASLSHLLLFGVLFYILHRQKQDGTTFWSFVFGYGILRFLTDFLREDPRMFGISMGQFLSLVMALVAAFYWIKFRKKQTRSSS